MDERTSIPVSLPHPNSTKSYWQDPPDPLLSKCKSSETLPAEVDTIIIGSGITGACIAYNLLQEGNHGDVVMLEAREACSGATGRNGIHAYIPIALDELVECWRSVVKRSADARSK